MLRRSLYFSIFILVVMAAVAVPMAQRGASPPDWPGYKGNGVTLLPSGWKIAPAGRAVIVGDLPMNLAPSPDGRFVAVSTSGYSKPAISVFDTHTLQFISRLELDHTWLGLVWTPDGTRLYASGSSENVIYELTFTNGRLALAGNIRLRDAERHPGEGSVENAGFVAGMAMSPDGTRLYATELYGERVEAIDLTQKKSVATAPLGAEAYATVLSPDGKTLYVSVWGGSKVDAFDAGTLAPKGEIAVGEHPNALTLTRDGSRLFVACANTNAVYVVDTAAGRAVEQISVALEPKAPMGSTPNGLALSPDGRTLAVADADNNTVALADVSKPGASVVEGWIPVGWYPTGVLFDSDGMRLFVLDGKGLRSAPNPLGPEPGAYRIEGQYSGAMFNGALSVIPVPNAAGLDRMTARVRQLTPYSDAHRLAPADAPGASPIPRRVGDSSPIKHVFYIIRENRTYDQILGDVAKANGDPALTLFGEDVTPNAHAITSDFATFDNFYVNAEVSYDGHAWSTGAIATDFVQKMWPANYGRREGLYLSEGGYKMRNAYGNIAAPPQGYLWDAATRAHVSVRSYGEFVGWQERGADVQASVPGLDGRINTKYPPFDLSVTDAAREAIWQEEFLQFDAAGTVPQLSIIRLPNDHTNGTAPGARTPRAYVADNDAALGKIVDVISHSRVWKDSAIFVLEDDAQNGPDHVDAHRSPLLAISPFMKRGVVDSTLYTTSGVLRTIELILGIQPMTQYDAAATPLYNAFTTTPNLAAYTHLDARVPLDEKNDWATPGARRSIRMNFSEADLAPDLELNQVIWESVHGRGSVMPPPRRAGFIRTIADER
jgi:DNA-binding beta-propeller fold protein YncE